MLPQAEQSGNKDDHHEPLAAIQGLQGNSRAKVARLAITHNFNKMATRHGVRRNAIRKTKSLIHNIHKKC